MNELLEQAKSNLEAVIEEMREEAPYESMLVCWVDKLNTVLSDLKEVE